MITSTSGNSIEETEFLRGQGTGAIEVSLRSGLNPGQVRCELRGWKKTRRAVETADVFILSGLAQQP